MMLHAVQKLCVTALLLCTVTCTIAAVRTTTNGPPVIKDQPESAVVRRNDPYTLNCDADKATHIRWYHNGQQITDASSDPNSHRILLPNGSLFFLRVATTKKVNDAGVYWCVAYNSEGATKSRNATIEVAFIEDDFLETPKPVLNVIAGESLILPCKPPRGNPETRVMWMKNGDEVRNNSRVISTNKGDLEFRTTMLEDSGIYECQAANAAGTKTSNPSTVTILERPSFLIAPKNRTVTSGSTVTLHCQASGYPTPNVEWTRLDGKMPLKRAHLSQDYTLELSQMTASDSGHYACQAVNEAGSISTDFHIKVLALPTLIDKPNDLVTPIGVTRKLPCSIEGDPFPLLLWRLPGDNPSDVLLKSNSKGRMHVQKDGSLLMEDLQLSDTGVYTCMATNSGGGVSARAKILTVEAFPPPVVGVAPQDQLISDGDTISMPCEPVSEFSVPTVTWWFREAAHLPENKIINSPDNGVTVSSNGALVIKNAKRANSGIYTCRITSETGEIEATAVVRYDMAASSIARAASIPPAPPSKPRVRALNETAVRLTWQPNSNQLGRNERMTYTVEYWRSDWSEWHIATSGEQTESVTVGELSPNTTYTFLIRSVTKHGQSFPSPWSNPVRLDVLTNQAMTPKNRWLTDRRLDKPSVVLISATAGSSRSVLLNWQGLGDENKEDGVLIYSIKYEELSEDGFRKPLSVRVATVLGSSSSSHLVRGLEPYTYYTFFLVPFWRSVEGAPTNSISLRTPEDIPSAAPQSLLLTRRSPTKALVTWDEVDSGDIPGRLLGYAVVSSCNGTVMDYNVTTPWLEINNILPGCLLTARVAAMTNIGIGPFSAPALLQMTLTETDSDFRFPQTVEQDPLPPPYHMWPLYVLLPLFIIIIVGLVLYLRGYVTCNKSSGRHSHTSKCGSHSLCSSHCQVNMYGEHQKTWTSSNTPRLPQSTYLLRNNHYVNDYAEPNNLLPSDSSQVEAYTTTALMVPTSPVHDISGLGQWTAFQPPPPPSCPPPPIIGQYSGGSEGTTCSSSSHSSSGDSYNNRIGGGRCGYRPRGPVVSRSSNFNNCYKRPCDEIASEHTYESYNHHRPLNGCLQPDSLRDCHTSPSTHNFVQQENSTHFNDHSQHYSPSSSSVSCSSRGKSHADSLPFPSADEVESIPLRKSPIEDTFPTFSSLHAAANGNSSSQHRTDQNL